MMKKTEILRIDEKGSKKMKDVVIEEKRIEILFNENTLGTISCTPKDLKYLVVGYLYCKGLISDANVDVNIFTSKVKVKQNNSKKIWLNTKRKCNANCVDIKTISTSMADLLSSSEFFLETGGCHIAGIFDLKERKYVYICEDVSRQSAIEKCIGFLVFHPNKIEIPALFLTGRVNFEIVQKCAKIGIQFIVTKAAVTSEAIDESKKRGITLIGFARQNSANIYSCFERIKTSKS